MKRGIFPIDTPRCIAMFHRIEMHIINATLQILLITDFMFPKSALPNAFFPMLDFAAAACFADIKMA